MKHNQTPELWVTKQIQSLELMDKNQNQTPELWESKQNLSLHRIVGYKAESGFCTVGYKAESGSYTVDIKQTQALELKAA
jgi:hypothetical protein